MNKGTIHSMHKMAIFGCVTALLGGVPPALDAAPEHYTLPSGSGQQIYHGSSSNGMTVTIQQGVQRDVSEVNAAAIAINYGNGPVELNNAGTVHSTGSNGNGFLVNSSQNSTVNINNSGLITTVSGASVEVNGEGSGDIEINNTGRLGVDRHTGAALGNSGVKVINRNSTASIEVNNTDSGYIGGKKNAINLQNDQGAVSLRNEYDIIGGGKGLDEATVYLKGRTGMVYNTGRIDNANRGEGFGLVTEFSEGGLVVSTERSGIDGIYVGGSNTRFEQRGAAYVMGDAIFSENGGHTYLVEEASTIEGRLTLNSGNTMEFALGSRGGSNQFLSAKNGMDITGANVVFDFTDSALEVGDALVLLYANTGIDGMFNGYEADGVTVYTVGDYSFTLSLEETIGFDWKVSELLLTVVSAVPEPSAYAAILSAGTLVALVCFRRRGNRK